MVINTPEFELLENKLSLGCSVCSRRATQLPLSSHHSAQFLRSQAQHLDRTGHSFLATLTNRRGYPNWK